MKKILITTGGTGGHVIPAKVIKEHLKESFEVYFSTDIRGLKYLSPDTHKTIIIDTPKLDINFYLPFKLIKIFFLLFKAIFFLKKEKIDKVISIGGYMSLPIIISAKILGLPIFLLEPNLVLGRGNKFFLNFSKKIFCYSKNLSNFPRKYLDKIETIKPLVFKEFYEYKKNEKINDKFCILIFGGSQGAKLFNESMTEVIKVIAQNFTIKVIQQTNVENIENLKKIYNSENIENEIFNFEKKFINLINKADLCITRAGATSLAEISLLNKPFIAIPLPTAKDNHQLENAKYYEKLGCCWILNQKNLNQDKLVIFLSNILKEKSDFNAKKSNLEKFNYKNSWNDINQKLQKILNEN